MRKYISLLLLVLSKFTFGSVPDIINFTTKDYASHSINFSFTQDSAGILYVGNAYCVLEYDGRTWRKIPVDDDKSALSLTVHQGKVFVGSSSEFGYLERDAQGYAHYKSLSQLLPDREIGEILDLYSDGDVLYFRTLYNVFSYADGKVMQLNPYDKDHIVYFVGKLGQKNIAFQQGRGLLELHKNKAHLNKTALSGHQVDDIIQLGDQIILLTPYGIIASDMEGSNPQKWLPTENESYSCLLKLSETEFLVGTLNDGLLHVNNQGKVLTHLTTEDGLNDNYIRGLFKDKAGNLWIALNNGFSVVKWQSPLRYLPKSKGIEGMGYCAIEHNDTLYVGTSTGLFFLPEWQQEINGDQKFKRVEGIAATINSLSVSKGHVIANQQAETYEIVEGKAKLLSTGHWYGSWLWRNSTTDTNVAFVGTHLGFSRYTHDGSHWNRQFQIKGFEESSRVFEIDDRGIFWVVQGNKGLFRVELNATQDSAIKVTNYVDVLKTTPQHFNDIFKRRDSIMVTSYGGTYLVEGDELKPLQAFENLEHRSHRIRMYSDSGLYAIYDDLAHILKLDEGKWTVSNDPISFSKSLLVGSAEFFHALNKNTFILGTQDGFALYNPNQNRTPMNVNCLIRGVELHHADGDSLLAQGEENKSPVLDYAFNNIRIKYAIPVYGENEQISYETQLIRKGKSVHNWQSTGKVNYKEYTNLREGKYEFKVRGLKGEYELGQASFEFEVLAPWYRSTAMKIVYCLLLLLVASGIRSRFTTAQKKLLEKNKRDLEIKEKLHHAEKLELELKNKENELAYMALTYTQKKDLLANLTAQLNKISKDMAHEDQIKFRTVKSAIANNLDDESNWENFKVHFDEKNDNFFQKLKEKESRMNESYLLFCSYVRMGKSNKEIADLLNISVAAVEKRKYRLKKKWNLPDDTSFTTFLQEL